MQAPFGDVAAFYQVLRAVANIMAPSMGATEVTKVNLMNLRKHASSQFAVSLGKRFACTVDNVSMNLGDMLKTTSLKCDVTLQVRLTAAVPPGKGSLAERATDLGVLVPSCGLKLTALSAVVYDEHELTGVAMGSVPASTAVAASAALKQRFQQCSHTVTRSRSRASAVQHPVVQHVGLFASACRRCCLIVG